jgi:hypothetical protein
MRKNTNKKPVKRPQQQKPKQKQPRRRKTPFGDAGAAAGSMLGGLFGNMTIGGNIGRFLGSGIGSIFGSGDYKMIGSDPSYNVLTNSAQIPKFSTTNATNIVCHREYLGDINGTVGFNNSIYALNPGISSTFPWLSTIAQNYQEYKFHGLVFEFRPLITDFVTSGAPGVVVMATNYNADVPAYATKQEMENSEYAVSVKPTISLMHGVECATNQTINSQKYIRTGNVPVGQDLRLYDLGNFQFATQANPVQDLGELWVTYCVEFFKPSVPNTIGGNIPSGKIGRSSISGANPLGLVQISNTGSIAATVTSTTISFVGEPGNIYFYHILWTGSAVTYTAPGVSLTGATFKQYLNNDSTGNFNCPQTGVTLATSASVLGYILCTLVNPGLITITLTAGGVIPTTFCDVTILGVDDTVTA